METVGRLPSVRTIAFSAPLRWLGGGWTDLWKAPGPCLAHGFFLAVVSFVLCYGVYATNAAYWVMALIFGFVFVAPMLAMGLYEAGRTLEQGRSPRLGQITFVRAAFRQDLAYLGLGLLVIFFIWGGIAQIVYGLSTYQLYPTARALFEFAVGTPEGRNMLAVGSLIGAMIGFLTFSLVVVSAPMLLDPRADVFSAVATSLTAVSANLGPMVMWAAIIALMMLAAAGTGFVLMIVIFPWLGLASWRAYRELVVAPLA